MGSEIEAVPHTFTGTQERIEQLDSGSLNSNSGPEPNNLLQIAFQLL
jgi:hypothetical protein